MAATPTHTKVFTTNIETVHYLVKKHSFSIEKINGVKVRKTQVSPNHRYQKL